VAVVAKAEVHEVDDRRDTELGPQLCCVLLGGALGIRVVDRHGIHPDRRPASGPAEVLVERREVAIGGAARREPLVYLEHVHGVPGHVLAREVGEHRCGSAAPAEGHSRSTAVRDARAQGFGDLVSGVLGDCLGVGVHLDLEGAHHGHAVASRALSSSSAVVMARFSFSTPVRGESRRYRVALGRARGRLQGAAAVRCRCWTEQ
jgi:hypothetical protein